MYKCTLVLLIILLLLSACGLPDLPALSVAAVSGAGFQATPVLITAPKDATPTPTPFQPLPPTPLVYPTGIPLFTPTSEFDVIATQEAAEAEAAVEATAEAAAAAATAAAEAAFEATAAVVAFPSPTATLPPTPVFTATPMPAAEEIEAPRGTLNILLLGSDQREGDSGFRTDTVILASIHLRDGTVSLVSFPRDLYVTIPYWGQDRINTAWQHGGFDSLAATLEYNFGVKPKHYILINFHSFTKVVDSLGGIDVQVGKPLVAKRQGRGRVEISEGEHHMNGKTALWYVRSRKETNDFDRGRRQQEVISAIATKVLSADGIRRAPELFDSYKHFVTTDLKFRDILPLLPAAAKFTDNPGSRINSYFIGPGECWDWISPGGGMVLLPNQPAIMEVIRKALDGN
jgi:LCP family protein required for cell wall assembly